MIDVSNFYLGQPPYNALSVPQLLSGVQVPDGHRWVLKQITVTHSGDEGDPDGYLSLAFGGAGFSPLQNNSLMWLVGPFQPNKFDTIDLSVVVAGTHQLYAGQYNRIDTGSWLTISINGIEHF